MRSVEISRVFWAEKGYLHNHEDYMSHMQTIATHINQMHPILAWLWMPCARYINSHVDKYCADRSEAP